MKKQESPAEKRGRKEDRMPKRKPSFNTIYISERVQECLRPIARCALTTVVAPMATARRPPSTGFSPKDEGRQSRRHPHEHLLGKAAHALAQRAGCVPVCGLDVLSAFDFPTRRGCRNAGSGGALPRVFLRQDGVLSVPRRFSSAARRARRALHLPHQRAPARECAADRCQP